MEYYILALICSNSICFVKKKTTKPSDKQSLDTSPPFTPQMYWPGKPPTPLFYLFFYYSASHSRGMVKFNDMVKTNRF